jgi:AraC-like DNA-binding protein
MKLDTLNPFIRYARAHTFYTPPKNGNVCYDCRLFYISHGDGSLFANGKQYEVGANTVIFLPPKTHYRFAFVEPTAVHIYVLNFDLVDDFSNHTKSLGTATEDTFDETKVLPYNLPEVLANVLVQNNGIQTRNAIAKCVEVFLQKELYRQQTASAHLKLALIDILREQQNGASDYKLARSVIEYIRDHYAMPDLSNQTIADEFHYHPYHISRVIKAYTKKTLHEYLIDYRLDMAKNLLLTTSMNVTLIAEKTGFSSYTYFIKLFREKMGKSPLQYRQTHKHIGF